MVRKTRSYRIYPSIGIARLGNSPAEFFIGPEAPGIVPEPPGGFKDALGRIKRQAARFRIYEFDGETAIREITAHEATITWKVHVANKKAEWTEFRGRFRETDVRRNAKVADRQSLIIDPGPKSVTPSQGPVLLNGGRFFANDVQLGELRTDDMGRLLVLGGFGRSQPSVPGSPIGNYANNDYWHDDTSDGTVKATINIDGAIYDALAAHVICAPPRFVPHLEHIVTLYDVMYEVAVNKEWLTVPDRPTFFPDIYQFFRRAAGYRWVNAQGLRGHGSAAKTAFDAPDILSQLSDPSLDYLDFRRSIFAHIRSRDEDPAQAFAAFMPQLSGDDGDAVPGEARTWLAVTRLQYRMMNLWADGTFDRGELRPPVELAATQIDRQPEQLTRAALEACVGGAFFPGIEMTYIAEDPANYSHAFRLAADRFGAGDVTKWMACPWQADFYECNTHWWPVARPDDVITLEAYEDALRDYNAAPKGKIPVFEDMLVERSAWDRGIVDDPQYDGDLRMVEDWHRLGFVIPKPGRAIDAAQTPRVMVEVQRGKYVGLDERAYFHILLNLDEYPDFLPKARELAAHYLNEAWRMQEDPSFETPEYQFFPYTKEAFRDRLQRIYLELRKQADTYEPALDTDYPNREACIERIRQLAPFNQLDGGWLRNLTQAGPISDIHALLFSIWRDEVGDGSQQLNHCNLYTELMHSVGIWLPDVTDEAYVRDTNFVDSAFTIPVFELAVSALSEEFFPELLGMTLQLEWEVLSLWPGVKRLRYHNIDAHFYTMHIGIDNASAGHGALARRAVELFLDRQFASGGKEAVDAMWRRIWNGYLAFAILGNLDADTKALIREKNDFQGRLEALVALKQEFGQFNHGDKRVGHEYINNWFENPPQFLRELVHAGYIVPGDPDNSPFFRLTSFDGPMYKVFSDDDLALWRDWILSLKDLAPTTYEPAPKMIEAIQTLGERAFGTDRHLDVAIFGSTGEGSKRESVSWWLTRPAAELLAALADQRNGLIAPFRPADSRFITEYLAEGNRMGQAWAAEAPNTGGASWRDVAVAWIKKGAILPAGTHQPAEAVEAAQAIVHGVSEPAASTANSVALLTTRRTGIVRRPWHRFNRYGMGAVH